MIGERDADMALMAGIHENDMEAMRRLLHCSILEANEIGHDIEVAPEGQGGRFFIQFCKTVF